MYDQKEYMKEYRKKNSEKLKSYYHNNKENQKRINQKFKENNPNYSKEWKEKNPNYNKEYFKNRNKNPIIKLQHSIGDSVYRGIKNVNGIKSQKTLEILGLESWDKFREHIESQFTEGMTWDNYGRKTNVDWSIDHIIPLSSASTLEEVKKLNYYTNLRPMWHIDNIKKGNKI